MESNENKLYVYWVFIIYSRSRLLGLPRHPSHSRILCSGSNVWITHLVTPQASGQDLMILCVGYLPHSLIYTFMNNIIIWISNKNALIQRLNKQFKSNDSIHNFKSCLFACDPSLDDKNWLWLVVRYSLRWVSHSSWSMTKGVKSIMDYSCWMCEGVREEWVNRWTERGER